MSSGDDDKTTPASMIFIIGGALAVGVFAATLAGVGVAIQHYSAPAAVATSAPAVQPGLAHDLESLARDYVAADDPQKDTVRLIIRHRFAAVDPRALPAEDRTFLREMMQ